MSRIKCVTVALAALWLFHDQSHAGMLAYYSIEQRLDVDTQALQSDTKYFSTTNPNFGPITQIARPQFTSQIATGSISGTDDGHQAVINMTFSANLDGGASWRITESQPYGLSFFVNGPANFSLLVTNTETLSDSRYQPNITTNVDFRDTFSNKIPTFEDVQGPGTSSWTETVTGSGKLTGGWYYISLNIGGGYQQVNADAPHLDGHASFSLVLTQVPEPSTLALAGIGAVGLLANGLRRRLLA